MLLRKIAPLVGAKVAVLVVTCCVTWSASAQGEPTDDPRGPAASSPPPAPAATRDASAPNEGAPQPTGVSLLSMSGVILRSPSESTLVQSLGISYAASDTLSLSLRFGAVHRSGEGLPAGTGLGNLVLGATVTTPIGEHVQLNVGLSTTIPTNAIGNGRMEEGQFAAELSATDWFGTMFLPNYLDITPGAGVSLTVANVTAHLQIDIHQLIRARAEQIDAYDGASTALAPDLSLSYPVLPHLSVFAHFSEFRMLTTPRFVAADSSWRSEQFVSGGASLDIEVGGARTLTGTLTYAKPISGPLFSQGYQAVELDLALAL
jgi:hypothetical protein